MSNHIVISSMIQTSSQLLTYLHVCLCFTQSGSGRSSSIRAPSVADSAAEYFDACDELMCASSSEMSDESGLSDGSSNSEPDEAHG